MNTTAPTPTAAAAPTIGMRTLLRHEALRTRGPLGVVAAATAVFSLVGAIVGATTVPFLQVIGIVLGYLAVGALLPAVLLVLVVDYWRSAYGRTGYLVHTLPVRGSRIFAARLLYGSFVTIAAGVASLLLGLGLALLIARYSTGAGGTAQVLDGLREALAVAGPAWTLGLLVLGALLIVSYLVQYYFAASIGSEGRLGALGPGGPVLVWFVVYLATQVLNGLSLLAVPFGIGMTGDGSLGIVRMNLWGAMVDPAANPEVEGMPLGFVVALLVVAALLAWRTAYSWNHKVSLR